MVTERHRAGPIGELDLVSWLKMVLRRTKDLGKVKGRGLGERFLYARA